MASFALPCLCLCLCLAFAFAFALPCHETLPAFAFALPCLCLCHALPRNSACLALPVLPCLAFAFASPCHETLCLCRAFALSATSCLLFCQCLCHCLAFALIAMKLFAFSNRACQADVLQGKHAPPTAGVATRVDALVNTARTSFATLLMRRSSSCRRCNIT